MDKNSQKELGQENYLKQWGKFETNLIKREKSIQDYEEFELTHNEISAITYKSDSFELKGLLNKKNIDSLKKKPVIVYFHGGFGQDGNSIIYFGIEEAFWQ